MIEENYHAAKHDAFKPRAGLMLADLSRALVAVAAVASISEERDEESGLSHLSHAAWNLLAILQMRERRA